MFNDLFVIFKVNYNGYQYRDKSNSLFGSLNFDYFVENCNF